ncbi:MAG: methyltransferase domain-containing protein [Bacteroidales bacterium]
MNETSKLRFILKPSELIFFQGKGIDIGCGPDPITPEVQKFDINDGDANKITEYVKDSFDYVFSSHCLEHMIQPMDALKEWWKLVKQDGYLIFTVPDEDLYEQGVFPSRFNKDHKATFTISKRKSWSSVSYNVLDMVNQLDNVELIKIELQDLNYDRSELYWGKPSKNIILKFLFFLYRPIHRFRFMKQTGIDRFFRKFRFVVLDQYSYENRVGQIFCVCKKSKKEYV